MGTKRKFMKETISGSKNVQSTVFAISSSIGTNRRIITIAIKKEQS